MHGGLQGLLRYIQFTQVGNFIDRTVSSEKDILKDLSSSVYGV